MEITSRFSDGDKRHTGEGGRSVFPLPLVFAYMKSAQNRTARSLTRHTWTSCRGRFPPPESISFPFLFLLFRLFVRSFFPTFSPTFILAFLPPLGITWSTFAPRAAFLAPPRDSFSSLFSVRRQRECSHRRGNDGGSSCAEHIDFSP